MRRPFHHGRLARATLVVTLTATLSTATIALPSPQAQSAAHRQHADEQRRSPDERAAGGERVDNAAPPADAATLLLAPARRQLALGNEFRLTLAVLGADDLRRMPATIRFDAGVLELVEVHLGDAWDGRPQPLLMFDSSRPGEIVIGLGLLDKDAAGIFGSAELLELEFRAIGRGDGRVTIERYAAIAAGSRPQPVEALAAEIIVR